MFPVVAAFPPCRAHDLYWPFENCPLALQRNPADEAYWLDWRADGSMIPTPIRVARIGADVVTTRLHRGSMFGKERCLKRRLTMGDWARVEDAVVAASFWMLDENQLNLGSFGGANWMIAGRRRHDYHLVKRLNPHDGLYDLGRLMFDLAGLDAVSL
jgi:hypothetical protein